MNEYARSLIFAGLMMLGASVVVSFMRGAEVAVVAAAACGVALLLTAYAALKGDE